METLALLVYGLTAVLTLAAAALALIGAYLLGLTLAAALAPRTPPPDGGARRTRFAVLIPAHDEELLIDRLLGNLATLDYPADLVDVHVVADNCADATAAVARRCGAHVHERADPERHGKGHALRWLLERVQAAGGYDAYVVLDADSVVDHRFLRAMDARLASGSQVVQAYYSVLNATASPLATLRYAALVAIHYVRPLGRATLGLSCGLKGNGMCFAAPVLERYSWRWFALAEDVEFHLALVREGIRVTFAPETSVLADMPVSFRQAASQNTRWEQGRLGFVRRYVPGLLAGAVSRRSPLRLDAAVEQLIPPLSVPFAAAALCVVAAVLLGAPLAAVLALFALGAQIVHLLAGLALVGAPGRAYLALGYAPVYILWKAGLYFRALAAALAGGGGTSWVRTPRAPATAAGDSTPTG